MMDMALKKRARSSLDRAFLPEYVVVSKSEKKREQQEELEKSEKRWGPKQQAAAAAAARSSDSLLDWASLPEGIVDMILNHIIQLPDYLWFAAVCKPWFSVARAHQGRRRTNIHKKAVPFLLIPLPNPIPEDTEAADIGRRLYSVTQNKFLDMEVEVPYPRRCCGSSHGWLATVEPLNLYIDLINPFSGKSLRLPRVNTDYYHVIPARVHGQTYELKVQKVVLSCDPCLSEDCDPCVSEDFVVVAIYSIFRELAYFIPGRNQGCWNYLRGAGYERFVDAAYHLGKCYVVDDYSRVLSLDVVSKDSPPIFEELVPPTPTYSDKLYLVESSSGADLLLVQRFHRKKVPCRRSPVCSFTWCFKVFKLLGLGSGGGIEKVEITSLGDDTLFLGDNHSLSVSASNFPGCLPNCIYYTHDCLAYSCYRWGPQDTGIYFLDTGLFAPLPHTFQMDMEDTTKQKSAPMPPPIWILPTLL